MQLPELSNQVSHEYGPLSLYNPSVPAGLTEIRTSVPSAIYPGVSRDIWIHRPRQTGSEPLNFVVFQDGWLYLDPDGPVRAGIVLDNLIAEGRIPPTVGIFVNPGSTEQVSSDGRKQRNIEYDDFGPDYGHLIRDEILPLVRETVNLKTGSTGNSICGGSSGGNCALTAAWHQSELFQNAICFVSSFVQIPDGNPYPQLLATASGANRPRVFQQVANRDIGWDRRERNWVAENLRTAAALMEAGVDLRLVVSDGGHSPNHGGVLLPDALIWAAGYWK